MKRGRYSHDLLVPLVALSTAFVVALYYWDVTLAALRGFSPPVVFVLSAAALAMVWGLAEYIVRLRRIFRAATQGDTP